MRLGSATTNASRCSEGPRRSCWASKTKKSRSSPCATGSPRRTCLRLAMTGGPMDNAKPEISAAMQTVADYIVQAGARPLPDEVAEKTKHHLLDTLAAMVSG